MADPIAIPAGGQADRGGPLQPLLTVEGLKRYFMVPARSGGWGREAVHAIDDVSFQVRKGEVLGIVGESGSGKSTLARLLMHLLKPDAGRLLFDGDPVGSVGISVADLRRRMQMVFQDSAASLNPRMTVLDNIGFGLRANGSSRRAARAGAQEALETVGLDVARFAGRLPRDLSGGQRQRVNIARALALQPRLLILDESVSALDKSVEAQILNLLSDLRRENGLTYIFISHDLNVMEYLSDRILVLYLGRIVEIGPVDRLYAGPAHPYTQALLRSKLSLDPRQRTAQAPLSGDPPSPIAPPPGCRFSGRCPKAEPVCRAIMPELTAVAAGAGHYAACHILQPRSGHSDAQA